jgi:hypothetical protein
VEAVEALRDELEGLLFDSGSFFALNFSAGNLPNVLQIFRI